MGEVYRADDLELGQSVALKFLPEKLAADPLALDRFRGEVRNARQIAHPNVCRMYDIGQADGHIFLSMEYIDGEDLAQVLRRMGRPSHEKALEIARQLCLGLAAAHESGVLHRDLKPANIMIDGRGGVRITDFGLAGLPDELGNRIERAGTPAYMAPEQLKSGAVSIRSDIYALGLILYELFTGRRVFDTNDVAELKRQHQTSVPSVTSTGTESIDPAVERAIQRCLEHDPQRRPSSVYAVLGSLPGGDPLAAALAAGETPSPELLAESGDSGGLKVRVAVPLLVIGLVMLGVLTWAAPGKSVYSRIASGKSDVELALRARDLLKEVTGDETPSHEASQFQSNRPYVAYIEKHDKSHRRWDRLSEQRPPAMVYWHRYSRTEMTPAGLHVDRVDRDNPPLSGPGSALIDLDPQGRLVGLQVVPSREPHPPSRDSLYAAEVLFKHAGLELSGFTAADVVMPPLVYCDEVHAFRGPYRTGDHEPATVQVGSYGGRPNYFQIVNGWDTEEQPSTSSAPPLPVVALGVVLLVAVNLIAYRNLVQNRCDRKGAFRLALFMLLVWMAGWAFAELRLHGSPDEVARQIAELLFGKPFGHAFAHAFIAWIAYVALEPYARRLWPRTLVTWTRLLMGRFRDPQLGRDVLAGGLIGCIQCLVGHLTRFVLVQLGYAPPIDEPIVLGGFRDNLSALIGLCAMALETPLLMLVLLVVLRLVLRLNWAAMLGFVLLPAALSVLSVNEPFGAATIARAASAAVASGLVLLALVRFGACAGLAAFWVETCLNRFAITTDLTQWYAAPAVLSVLTCVALLLFGFHTSLAGRSLFRDTLLNDR